MTKNHFVFCMSQMSIGGAEKVLTHLLTQLKSDGIKLTLVVNKPIVSEFFVKYFNDNSDINIVAIPNINWKRPRNFFMKNIWRLFRWIHNTKARRKYYRIFRSADVVFDYLNFATRPLRLRPKIPFIAVYHSSFPQFVIDKEIKKIKYYTKLIGLSESFVHDFREMYPDVADKIISIYNPIQINDIRNVAITNDGPDGKYFVCCNRMHWHKDMETVIRAFDKFYINENPNCKLYMVGDGDEKARWQKISDELPSATNIIWVDEVPNPFGYIKNALALIMSSYNEGLPTVLCEAMALNTLCIASNCKSGTGEIMCNGNGGLLFEPGNNDELAKHMSDVYNNRIDTQKIKATATDGLKRFEPSFIAKQIIELCKAL